MLQLRSAAPCGERYASHETRIQYDLARHLEANRWV